MCGIAGIISEKPLKNDILQRIADLIKHRGPDDSGIWQSDDRKISLAHRRLSIIDLSDRGTQPMQDTSGRYVITYNGEIYNYLEIRAELKTMGVEFNSHTDTEVILEAYKMWGEKCLDRFNGMFAFALYDTLLKKMFCARDRYGEKPFLYVVKNGFFAFASEYKALLALKPVSAEYDHFQLLRYAHRERFGLDQDRQTLFKDILQLCPGEMMTLDVDSMNFNVQRYWDVFPNPEYARMNDADARHLFRGLVVDAVRLRMRSDVRVGSCLSGGLDSSAIVGIARYLLGPDAEYHTFTGRFPGTHADEWEYAKEVVRENNTVSHVVTPTDIRLSKELPDFIWYNELPVGGSSQFAQWCVFKLAREKGITVLLDGQGADELLGGYEQIFEKYVRTLKMLGKSEVLERELPGIKKRYPLALAPTSRNMRDKLPFALRKMAAHGLNRGTSMLFGVRSRFIRRLLQQNSDRYDDRFHLLGAALYRESFNGFLTALLRYGDRNSMAHSREVRLPFCDHRLTELIFSLPPEYIMGEAQTKRMLRKGLAEFMPPKVNTRWNKQGFRPPQELWFQNGPLLDQVEEIIRSKSFAEHPFWDPSWWIKVVKRAKAGDGAIAGSLWQPFILDAWEKHFVDRVKGMKKEKVA